MLKQVRAGLYLRVRTEGQELENQRAEIAPFIERRGWKLEYTFEDVVSGGKTEKDRIGFADRSKARDLFPKHRQAATTSPPRCRLFR